MMSAKFATLQRGGDNESFGEEDDGCPMDNSYCDSHQSSQISLSSSSSATSCSSSASSSTEKSLSKSSNAAQYYNHLVLPRNQRTATNNNTIATKANIGEDKTDLMMIALPQVPEGTAVTNDYNKFPGEEALALVNSTNGQDATGTTMFQNFLLCLDDKEGTFRPANGKQQGATTVDITQASGTKALLDQSFTSASSSSSSSSTSFLKKLQQRRITQALRNRRHKKNATDNNNTNNSSPKKTTALARHTSATSNQKAVSLPHFMWQPSDGLCCRAEHVHYQNDNDGLIVFETPMYGDDDDDDNSVTDARRDEERNDRNVKGSAASGGYSNSDKSDDDDDDDDDEYGDDDNELLLILAGALTDKSSTSDYDKSSTSDYSKNHKLEGGTAEDPRYVPRPSSTTPGLKEISKLVRTSSCPEDNLQKKFLWLDDFAGSGTGQPTVPFQQKAKSSRPSAVVQYDKSTGNVEAAAATASSGSSKDMPRIASSNSTKKITPASAKFGAPSKLTKSTSTRTPPVQQRQKMHRRTKSDDKSNAGVPALTALTSSSAMAPSRTAISAAKNAKPSNTIKSRNNNQSTNKKSKIMVNPMMNMLFRRGGNKMSSFRKSKLQALLTGSSSNNINNNNSSGGKTLQKKSSGLSNGGTITASSSSDTSRQDLGYKTGKNNSAAATAPGDAADIANILASLALTLKHRDESAMAETQKWLGHCLGSDYKDDSIVVDQKNGSKFPEMTSDEGQPLSSLVDSSMETQSDTVSSEDDIFGSVDEEDEDDFEEEDDIFLPDDAHRQASKMSACNSDKVLWAAASKNKNVKLEHHKSRFHHRHHKYTAALTDAANSSRELRRKKSSSMMPTATTELTRCNSVDTAKASNLSCDPASDRARLLDLQALLNQQKQEELRKANSPPIDFDAPDGDNVIRVRDAMCEIEVLPKRQLKAEGNLPPTAAEF